ncbi:hypothetical protein QJQ45_009591 [Haematococcus lacustris]|nr:hypothetical protein QJQ45_009591 [Haematococcus lacustris]
MLHCVLLSTTLPQLLPGTPGLQLLTPHCTPANECFDIAYGATMRPHHPAGLATTYPQLQSLPVILKPFEFVKAPANGGVMTLAQLNKALEQVDAVAVPLPPPVIKAPATVSKLAPPSQGAKKRKAACAVSDMAQLEPRVSAVCTQPAPGPVAYEAGIIISIRACADYRADPKQSAPVWATLEPSHTGCSEEWQEPPPLYRRILYAIHVNRCLEEWQDPLAPPGEGKGRGKGPQLPACPPPFILTPIAESAAAFQAPLAAAGPSGSSPTADPSGSSSSNKGPPADIGSGLAGKRAFQFDPSYSNGHGLRPRRITAGSAALGVWDEVGCLESFHSSKLTRSQVQHDSGLIHARRNTQRWNDNIKLELQHLAAATPAGTSPSGHPAASGRHPGHLGCSVGGVPASQVGRAEDEAARTHGGWGAKAMLQDCCKVVERPNSGKPTDRLSGKVVTVHGFCTSLVSSATNNPQPCEEELDRNKPTRREGWNPQPGQVQHRLLRSAWSKRFEAPVRGLMWCPKLDQATPGDIGEWAGQGLQRSPQPPAHWGAPWRPLELCSQEVNSGIHSSCHHSAAKPMGRLVACVPNEDPERLKRVLDAKHRTIGIDTDALAQQADERRERERQEKERDAAFAQLSNYWADQLSIQQQAADKLRREVASELDSFRETNQLKFTRKEWDINRPDHKKIDEPARVGDDDPRLGTSSMQRFEGEDLSAGDRKKAQNEQAKQWWEEQAAHKAALKAAQQEAEQAYAELARYQDMLQLQAKADEAAIRREMSTTTTEINKHMAEEKRLKALQEKAANLAANLAEIDATLNSPFMTEDPNLAASAMSAYRVRKDHYKGMSEAEKQAILATQLAQMEEKKARDAAREAEDAQYARNQNGILRAMDAQAARVDDFKRQQLAKAADVLRKQTEEKAARDKALSELYANKIAPEFFQQFGTSHR